MANRTMYGPPAKSLLPTRQPRGGLLGNMANPLMYAGLGLLSQGPSLTPISPFQGLGQGLALGMQANRDQREAALDEQRMEMERQKMEAAARAAAAPSYTNVPGVGLVQTNAEGGPSVAVPTPAKEPDDPLEKFRAWQALPEEDRAAFSAYQEATRPPGVQVYNAPTGYQPDPENPGALMATPGGPADPNRPQPAEIREERARAEAKAQVSDLLDQYVAMASPVGLYGTDAEAAASLRREMAERVARIRQPTGILTESDISRVEEDLFDVGGPYDASRAEERANNLRRIWGLDEGEQVTTRPAGGGDSPAMKVERDAEGRLIVRVPVPGGAAP